MKKTKSPVVKKVIYLLFMLLLCFSLIFYAEAVASGVKDGIELLIYQLIPSLFPFMVFSAYISSCVPAIKEDSLLHRSCGFLFKSNGYCVVPFFLGILGGYPVGASLISDLRKKRVVSENEAERLFYWCINPSPAFTVTAVGTFLLKNTFLGFILYFSCIFASLTVGILCRFLSNGEKEANAFPSQRLSGGERLVGAVSSAGHAMLGICGWVLCFSAFCSALKCFVKNDGVSLSLKIISEVTAGCREAVESGFSLPVIAALLSFGGLAVICQISSYSAVLGIQTRRIICSRLINAAFSAVYCELFLKLFPQSREVFATITAAGISFPVYHSAFASIVLIIMCSVFILEVDKGKKMC